MLDCRQGSKIDGINCSAKHRVDNGNSHDRDVIVPDCDCGA